MMTQQPVSPTSPVSPRLTDVKLELKSRYRRLRISLSPGGYLYVEVTHPRSSIQFAFLCGPKITECRLDHRYDGQHVLWCGDAAFDVSDKEASAIRRVYAPLGLRLTPEGQE